MATSGTFSASWESSTWAGQPKKYNWSGNWSKSGTTITLSGMTIYLSMVNPAASGTGSGSDNITISPGGSAQNVTFTWSGGNASNTQSLSNVSFSVGTTATSQTIQCIIDGEVTGSTTINFDATAVAPAIEITAVASGASARNPHKVLGASNTRVTVGDPALTTVRYYVGTRDNQTSLSTLAAELTTESSGRLPTSYIAYGDAVQYNQAIGLRAVASNSAGLSAQAVGFSYGRFVFLPAPEVSTEETFNSDGSITTTFTLAFDNGAAEFPVIVQYRSASGHVDSYTSSAWSSWRDSNQETVAAGATGTQTIHFAVTRVGAEEVSYCLRLSVTGGSAWPDYDQSIYYVVPHRPLYGSVNGATKKIQRLYGSVNGQTKEIRQLYGSVNGLTKRIF